MSSSSEPAAVIHTYAASNDPILNPERGFFTPYELPGLAGFSPVRVTGNSLVHLNIRLDEWRETDIPQDVLDGLDSNFADIRDAGVKAIIRFAYNEGPYPDSEPDASKAQILRHIEQLTPFLQKNTDVTAWVEAGFIGAWGEWHTSTNGLDNITDKRDILNALLAAIPDRYVQVRYPANIIEMYPNPEDAAKARVAHHNDCFLSSNTDVGTYERDGVITIERDQKYLAELTRFTPMSGETCAPNPPRSECVSAMQEMRLLHVSALNEAYHKGILRSWEDGSCMENINRHLGYLLTLTSTDFNEGVKPGGILNLTVHLQNTGFASIVNERPVYVVLVGEDGIPPYEVKLDIDPRRWEFGNSSFNVKLHIPSSLIEGEYRLALWLPDAYETLRDNPLYAIRFADDDMWDEATGYNYFGSIQVDKTVGGTYQRGKEFDVFESTVLMEGVVPSVPVAVTNTPTSVETLLPPTATPIPSLTPEPVSVSTDNTLISNIQILNQDTYLTIRFDFSGTAADINGFQVFLDVDQDPSTGYSINGIGADFLLENGTLNSYSGTGNDWSWTDTNVLVLFDNANNVAQWLFDTKEVGKPSALDFACQLVDTNWDAVSVSQKTTYIFK